jgi:glycosyltransferase involved in cell wall biosynthesis
MTIAVNMRHAIPGAMDGIGWFEFEVMRRVAANHPEHTFHFLFDRPGDRTIFQGANIKCHTLLPPARRPLLMKAWNNIAVPFLLRRIQADCYISSDGQAALTTQVPQLIVIHDINFEHHPEALSSVYRSYLLTYSRRFARKASRIATVSHFSASDIHTTYGIPLHNIDVVYNGANEVYQPLDSSTQDEVRASFSNGHPYFLFVSSIHPRKNLQRLLPAFDHFIESTRNSFRLIVVGKKTYMTEEIERSFGTMKHADHVVWTGRLDATDLARVTASAFASCYVSYYEGFGIPIVEAFRCGTPVITSNVTSMPEVAADAALLIDPWNEHSIFQAMMDLYSNPGLRDELIQKGLRRSKAFSWNTAAEKMWQSIEKILKHG